MVQDTGKFLFKILRRSERVSGILPLRLGKAEREIRGVSRDGEGHAGRETCTDGVFHENVRRLCDIHPEERGRVA